ncbi:MAG: hypothetical protein J6B01_10030 [Ruminococcus sp.]|nr:hypothetical protein [Ruminococcus sp.]MBP3380798.1 hypothetical protein [Ruminococcus sp.]
MNSNLEIERKFLVEFPDTGLLDITEKLDILQTYLKDGEDHSQRRVRKICKNGEVSYVYTEKIFYSAEVRKETEFEISREDYERLAAERKTELKPIEKTRLRFLYKDQRFELDIYPFSRSLAILELELEDPGQEIFFPDHIKVVKEVTGVDAYSNSALGNSNAFPEEAGTKGEI